jgi:hypothetical protein
LCQRNKIANVPGACRPLHDKRQLHVRGWCVAAGRQSFRNVTWNTSAIFRLW